MDQYVGLDVSQKLMAICVVDEDGNQLWRGSCATSPGSIAAVLQERAPRLQRAGMETGPLYGFIMDFGSWASRFIVFMPVMPMPP